MSYHRSARAAPWMCLAVAGALILALGGTNARAQASPPRARVIAVQVRIAPGDITSFAEYRQHLAELFQQQVVPLLRADTPNLIVMPEDTGLPAAFQGERGAWAREQSAISDALLALGWAYSQPPLPELSPIVYYAYTLQSDSLAQLLCLSLTDVLWRAFHETMAHLVTMPEVARASGGRAWLLSCTDVSSVIDRSTDPAEVFVLGNQDPPSRDYVYVARDRDVYNTAFLYGPNGRIVASARKPYLVEMEEADLGFTYGPLSAVAPIDLGFARAGVLISKDAWMPDITDRLAILGANLFVQPEAFMGGWTLFDDPAHIEDWLPDNLLQSAWSMVQKYGGYRYGVMPGLTGQMLGLPFDGQSAIIGDAVPGTADWAYVGVDPLPGFLSTAPWAMPDPGMADPTLSLEQRRALLREVGFALYLGLPIGLDYVETAVAADIAPEAPYPVQPTGDPGCLGTSAAVAPGAGEQTCPAVASDGLGRAYAVWQDSRDGRPQIYIARTSPSGKGFGHAKPVAPSAHPQRTPSIVVTPKSVYVAWQEDVGAERRIMVSRSASGGEVFGAPSALPTTGSADEWLPVLASDGAAARHWKDRPVYLAWVRTVGGNERIWLARTMDGSLGWQAAAVEPSLAHPRPNTRNNQWAPAMAASGDEVAVAWADFRDFSWDIRVARSSDGGATFGESRVVSDGPTAWERVNTDTTLAFAPDGGLLCGWTDVRERKPAAKARVASVGPTIGVSVLLSPDAPRADPSWRPVLAPLPSGMAAVWQEFGGGGNDIYLAVSRDGGATFGAPCRVDDGGDGPSYQFSPKAVAAGGGLLVVWEDTRGGCRQLRFAVGAP